MSRYVPDTLRKLIAERAENRCEYCRVFERHSYLSFHIEHIISLKHGGKSIPENLAFACPICNINKGADIATVLDAIDEPIRFFNPRTDIWDNHFEIDSSGLITPKTKIGQATIKIFDLNHPDSIIERKALIEKNLF